MRRAIYALTIAIGVSLMTSHAPMQAQQPNIAEPFKLGTFLINGKPTVGIVLRDTLILDAQAANADLMLNPSAATVAHARRHARDHLGL